MKFIQMLCFVTDVVLFTCQAEEGAGDAQRRTTWASARGTKLRNSIPAVSKLVAFI